MTRVVFICVFLFATIAVAKGQYFQFSQYNFTSQRVNPAMVASSDYASISLLFRSQRTLAETGMKSTFLEGIYPILQRRTGRRWSGAGFSVMDDRAGGIFLTREASLSYAVNTFVSRYQTLSLGFRALYQQRSVDLHGLVTGSQYIPDRGFDRSIFNGETIDFLQSKFITFSAGLYWQAANRQGERIAWLGGSFFDFNRPREGFLEYTDSRISGTAVVEGGVRIYEDREFSISPRILYTYSGSKHQLNVGAVTSYYVRAVPNQVAARIDFLTGYIPGRSGIAGIQLHRENFALGFSADFPIVKTNPANLTAFEVGVSLRRLVEHPAKVARQRRDRQQRRRRTGEEEALSQVQKGVPESPASDDAEISTENVKSEVEPKSDLRARIQHKQDSVIAQANAGELKQRGLVLETVELHFNFAFNSTEIEGASARYLDELAEVLKENAHLRILLIGHTDNLGSARYNERLSLIRAEKVKSYMVNKGVEPERIVTDGRGMAQPLNNNATEEERALNRRVEVRILYQ